MALGNFDHIERGTTLVRNKDGVRFHVSDFTFRRGSRAEMISVLILVELDEGGFGTNKRRVFLEDTPANRTAWSKK